MYRSLRPSTTRFETSGTFVLGTVDAAIDSDLRYDRSRRALWKSNAPICLRRLFPYPLPALSLRRPSFSSQRQSNMTSEAIDIESSTPGLDQSGLTSTFNGDSTTFPGHQGIACVSSWRELSPTPDASVQSLADLPETADSETLPGSAGIQALKQATGIEFR